VIDAEAIQWTYRLLGSTEGLCDDHELMDSRQKLSPWRRSAGSFYVGQEALPGEEDTWEACWV